jgi:hypothetical protein
MIGVKEINRQNTDDDQLWHIWTHELRFLRLLDEITICGGHVSPFHLGWPHYCGHRLIEYYEISFQQVHVFCVHLRRRCFLRIRNQSICFDKIWSVVCCNWEIVYFECNVSKSDCFPFYFRRGISSTVRRCICKETGKEFAAKIIDLGASENNEPHQMKEQTRQEIAILRQVMGHPYISE